MLTLHVNRSARPVCPLGLLLAARRRRGTVPPGRTRVTGGREAA